MNTRVIFCIVFLFLGTVASSSNAQPLYPGLTNHCDFCVASQGISPIEMGRTGARYDVRYLRLSHSYRDGVLVDGDEHESHLTSQVSLSYYLFPQLSVVAIVPYVSRTGTMTMDEMTGISPMVSSVSNSGIGDIIALARVKVFSDTRHGNVRLASINTGVKFATGNTTKRDNNGELADAHLQLGSGSTDLLLGTSLLYGHSNWAMAANVTGVFTGKGANEHQFGNNINYDATFRYGIYVPDDGPTFFTTLGLTGEWRTRETEKGSINENSGGNVTYLAPGIQVFLTPSITFEGSFQLPVLHQLNGEQLGEDFRVMSGIQYLF